MKIAILGFGVVGSGTYEVLENAGYKVGRVLDIRKHEELGEVSTTNYDDILNDKEIGVVAEAIGGLEPAHTFLVKALKAGKHVVSSNKHLICTYYEEFLSLAKENGGIFTFRWWFACLLCFLDPYKKIFSYYEQSRTKCKFRVITPQNYIWILNHF